MNLLHCKHVDRRREGLQRVLAEYGKSLSVRTILSVPEVAKDVEKLIANFLNLLPTI